MEPNEQQFLELVHRHRDLIWRVCSGFRLSAAWTTEDAFHEVLCDLWRGYGSFNHRSSESTWVYRVATNTLISLYRKTGNQPTAAPMPAADPGYRDDDYRDLVQMIDALPEPGYAGGGPLWLPLWRWQLWQWLPFCPRQVAPRRAG